LEYAKRQGDVTEVDLISVTAQTTTCMGGTEMEVELEESEPDRIRWSGLTYRHASLHA
jgi:hypothetical protein